MASVAYGFVRVCFVHSRKALFFFWKGQFYRCWVSISSGLVRKRTAFKCHVSPFRVMTSFLRRRALPGQDWRGRDPFTLWKQQQQQQKRPLNKPSRKHPAKGWKHKKTNRHITQEITRAQEVTSLVPSLLTLGHSEEDHIDMSLVRNHEQPGGQSWPSTRRKIRMRSETVGFRCSITASCNQ